MITRISSVIRPKGSDLIFDHPYNESARLMLGSTASLASSRCARSVCWGPAGADLFEVEAAGLSALRELGGVRVPAVVRVSPCLLVLEPLRPCGEGERFWEQLARMIAALHTSAVSGRFSWHRDGWQCLMRQD